MTPQERGARGVRIKEMLASDDVRQAFAECERDIVNEWRKTWIPWKRNQKWHELRGLQRLQDRLTSYAGRAPRD